MKHVKSFFVSLMDNFMHPSKPMAVFPLAGDTYSMTENKKISETGCNDSVSAQDSRQFYHD